MAAISILMKSHHKHSEDYERSCSNTTLPIGSLVVPFWDYIIGF